MRHYFITALAAIAWFATPAYAIETGKLAPEFHVKDIDGKDQSLEKYAGRIIVLEWHNPGCPFVHKHYDSGNMQALQKEAHEKGVVWLTVNSSGPGKEGSMDAKQAKTYLAGMKAQPTGYILDPHGALGKLYGAKATPHMFVIDAHGILAYQGAIDDKPTPSQEDVKTATNYVRAAFTALSTNYKVTTPETRAYGCSVKYE